MEIINSKKRIFNSRYFYAKFFVYKCESLNQINSKKCFIVLPTIISLKDILKKTILNKI